MRLQGPANVDAIGLLVELGANLWSVMKDADMETPLHMASRSGRLDIVEKLLRCGADYSKKTKVSCSLHHTCVMLGSTKHAPSKPEEPSVPLPAKVEFVCCFAFVTLHDLLLVNTQHISFLRSENRAGCMLARWAPAGSIVSFGGIMMNTHLRLVILSSSGWEHTPALCCCLWADTCAGDAGQGWHCH